MKVEVSQLNSCRREVRIEVPADAVAVEIDRAAERVARSARLPGFRKGKAPVGMVRTRYGKAIEEEAIEHLLQHCTREALEQQGLKPLHTPQLSGMEYQPGTPLTFRTVFEVRPQLSPQGYGKLAVSVAPEPVAEAAVEESLEALRQSNARLLAVEGRGAAAGDVLLADVRWWRGSRQGKPTERRGVNLEVGSHAQHEAFNRALEGLRAEETREFEVEYPADYRAAELAGARILYRVKAHAVRERQVPALDDALAREMGEFADLAALRAELRRRLEEEAKGKARAEAVRQLLDALLAANQVEVPEVMVEAQLDDQMEDVARALVSQGVPPERIQIDWKKERERWRDAARRSVAARLLLEAIADKEEISASESEVDERLEREAKSLRQPVASLRARLEKSGAISALEKQIRRDRVLDFLMSGAKIERVEEK